MDLGDWNAALLDDLRARGRRDQRLYLYVDRETLADLSRLDEATALEEFCAAVNSRSGTHPFHAAALEALAWKRRGFLGDPSFVADLAMTVLAVTEEPLGSQNGVYRRQNQLLGLPTEAAEPPGYGEDVPQLWRVWSDWLLGPGAALGHPSAKTHEHWTLQGWARSQGLIRHHDRLRIEQYFEDGGLGQNTEPSAEAFLTWLRYRGASGQGLLARVSDQAALEVLKDVLDDEADRWSREGPRVRARGLMRGLLCYDDWSETVGGALENRPAWHGVPLDVGAGETYEPSEFDEYVQFSVARPSLHWLREGVSHRLCEGTTVQLGGADVYVMRDAPLLEGRLQCRVVDRAASYHVLVHSGSLPTIEAALADAGAVATGRRQLDHDWVWLENIWLEADAPALHVLGLGSLLPSETEQLAVEGGLRITGSGIYLSGNEPDLAVPQSGDRSVVLDGAVIEPAPADRCLHLATRCLEPGLHIAKHVSGDVAFTSAAFMQQVAVAGDAGRPLRTTGRKYVADDAVREPPVPYLAGAVVRGLGLAEPLVVRCSTEADCLVLTKDGELHQIWPNTPQWLRRSGLDPQSVDVNSIAELVPRAAAVIVRQRHSGRKVGVACNAAREDSEIRIPHQPRSDLVGELISQRWTWVGEPQDERARSILSSALRWRPPLTKARECPTVGTSVRRRNLVDGPLANNPYDDILAWLSEQERGSVPTAVFAESWAWLCRRYGQGSLADGWRLALTTLSMLGHIERDFGRGRVAVAPAAAVALPDSRGLFVLTGARPIRLAERLDDADDDDEVVGSAASALCLDQRTPVDADNRPIGPATMYLELDMAARTSLQAGLGRLGVAIHGCTSAWLLNAQPSMDQAAAAGQAFTYAPGRDPMVYARATSGAWTWMRCQNDERGGLYQYRQRQRKVFAWRAGVTQPLTEIELAAGRWLARSSVGQRSLIWHELTRDRLFVPANLPLPAMLGRALALRTGQPPYRFRGRPTESAGELDALVYENIKEATAQMVAALLHQDLRTEYSEMRAFSD